MKKLILIFTLVLALAFTACGNGDNGDGGQIDEVANGGALAPIDGNGDQNGEPEVQQIRPNLPERDFEGMEIRFFTMTEERNRNNFEIGVSYREERMGEVVNDAVWQRNRTLEDRYNFTIVEHLINTTANATDIQPSVMAGDDLWQILMLNVREASNAARQGLLLDLTQLDYIDFEMPWWDSQINDDLTIGRRLFYAIGDMNLMANNATWATFFNQGLIADFGLESPFDLVREGRWTIDRMHEMARVAVADLDGNGQMDPYDRWGALGSDMNTTFFFFGSGGRYTRKDADDIPYLVTELDNILRALDIVFDFQFDNDTVQSATRPGINTGVTPYEDPIRVNFRADRGLFYTAGLLVYTLLRDMETPFGMVPMPMVLPEQTRFYTTLNPNNANTVAIPISVPDAGQIAFALEAIMAESRYTLRPAYFEVAIERQFMRDEESIEMLEIILDSRMYDLMFAYGWGGLLGAIEGLTATQSRDVASVFERLRDATELAIEEAVETFREIW